MSKAFIKQLYDSNREKEFDSLKSYLSTLIYGVTHDGDQSQKLTEHFFGILPELYQKNEIARIDNAA